MASKGVIKKKKRAVGKSIYDEELQSAAYRGLVDAANRYNLRNKVPFPNYAAIRILGEMDEYVRELTWGGRYNHVNVAPLSPHGYAYLDDQEPSAEQIATEVLRRLPQKGRQIFRWHYCDGMSMKEIGENLHLSESMVSKLVKRYIRSVEKAKNASELFDILDTIPACPLRWYEDQRRWKTTDLLNAE